MSDLFPIFLRLRNRRALVVGGGTMAALRVKQLLAVGARVTVIAPVVNAALDSLAASGSIELLEREFVQADVTRDYFIVIGATNLFATNAAVAQEAEKLGQLYNVVDDVEHSNFFTPAVVERGDLQIAISTNGNSPVLARRLRQELEAAIPETFGEWVKELGRLREKLKLEVRVDADTRKKIVEEVIERATGR